MKKFSITGQSVLAFAAALGLGALAIASAIRRDGGACLLLFLFAYICYDLGKGFLKERKEA